MSWVCYFYVSVDKDTLFKESDFVSAHTALTPETAGKIARDHISLKFTSKIWRKGCETLRSNYYKYIISVARWCANKKVIESNNPVWFWFSIFGGKNRKLQRSRGTSRRESRLTHSASELSGFTCTNSLTMNEKFQYCTRPPPPSAVLKISSSLLVNESR